MEAAVIFLEDDQKLRGERLGATACVFVLKTSNLS